MDPSFSLWPAVPVLGVIASCRQMLYAERRGYRLSDRSSDLAFLLPSFSAPLDLAELLRGTA